MRNMGSVLWHAGWYFLLLNSIPHLLQISAGDWAAWFCGGYAGAIAKKIETPLLVDIFSMI
jgi:hypothetical protein